MPMEGLGTKETTQNISETKLPELELKQILRSAESIENGKKVGTLFPWGDYTFLINGENVILYNERLAPVFKETAKVSTNWSEIGDKYGFTHQDREISFEKIDTSNLSNQLHKMCFKLLLKKYKEKNPQNNSWIKSDFLSRTTTLGQEKEDLTSVSDGRYIILTDKTSPNFKIIDTQDERGITLSPENWKKYDSSSKVETIPKDIQDILVKYLERNEQIKELNDKYSGMVTDLSISILDKSNLNAPKIFSDALSGIENNLLVDPTNKNIVFYCQEGTPKNLKRLDTSGDPSSWKAESANFPKQYKEIKNLQLDPTGAFFLFYSEDNLVMLSKDSLEEVKRIEGITNVNFDAQGRIRGLDKEKHLVLYEVDYSSLGTALARRKAQALTTGVDIKNIFSQKSNKSEQAYDQKAVENLQPIKKEWEDEILPQIVSAQNLEEVLSFRSNLNILRQTLRTQNLTPDQIKFITEGIESTISLKEKQYAFAEADDNMREVEKKLQGPMSISTINELRTILDKIKPIEGALELVDRERARKLAEEVNKSALELFGREGNKVVEELNNLMEGTKKQLDSLTNKNEFDDWMEFRFPQLKSRLGTLLQDCPLEAFEAAAAITKARNDLVQIADNYSKKFELEYAKVREQAVERTDTVVQTLSDDVSALTNRLLTKQFKTRDEAEQYLNTSEAKRVLEDEILELAKNNPDAAKELERGLKVSIANSLGAIERGGANIIAETGQQMIMFGDTSFPRFEGKVKEKHKVKADLTFVLDERSKGPGIAPDKFYGDVELVVTDTKGVKRTVRLYESLGNEDEWRLGMLSYRGDAIPASYVTAEDFKKVKKNFKKWESGELKEKDKELREEISKLFASREKVKNRQPERDIEWQESYKAKMKEYSKFCSDNHILLFRRMENVKKENTIDENGKGYVPKWQNHWVPDPTTENYLEQMAKHFKMQGDLQEGILNLYGHAGTGKDVLIKMFASKEKANRPYFAVDCTKWTTEYELAEDVVLEAKNGATQTVRVPSSVLSGIQTPGGLVYFNEINGMPEQAQIFLHALFDEKRAMTLKTSSGKVVQALPSVLFACSMNPNYPGTFEPQFATKSRMVSMEVDYPPLQREIKDGEPKGRENPYNSSEALRIGRGVESLVDFTYELNMDKNEFVKVWDKNVNGINNDAPAISKLQEFDLNVVKALIQFAARLRQDFKKNFEKTSERRGDLLPVFQPITLREMRRCAYALSKIPDAEKISKDSDDTARELIKEFFLSNIYKTDDRKKIEDALKVMNSKNRLM